jgi:hypothetical protein
MYVLLADRALLAAVPDFREIVLSTPEDSDDPFLHLIMEQVRLFHHPSDGLSLGYAK